MTRFVVLAFIASVSFAHAQQRPASPQPTDAGAPVPLVQYESAFTRYTPYTETDPAEWRKVNEEVAKAGGHIKMFGGSHAGHGSKPSPGTPPTQKPAASRDQPSGPLPKGAAPQSPPDAHKGH